MSRFLLSMDDLPYFEDNDHKLFLMDGDKRIEIGDLSRAFAIVSNASVISEEEAIRAASAVAAALR